MKTKILCVVQLNWSAEDYRNQAAFEAKIRTAMEQFRGKTQGMNAEALVDRQEIMTIVMGEGK